MDEKKTLPDSNELAGRIVQEYMSQGKFDHLRRQLQADVDTKPSFQNVKQRMETAVANYLQSQTWRPDMNKNQLRDNLKKHLLLAPFLRPGVSRLVEQSVGSSLVNDMRPQLTEITYEILGIKVEKAEPMDVQDDFEPVNLPANFSVPPPPIPSNIKKEEEEVEDEPPPPGEEGHAPYDYEDVAVPGEEPLLIEKKLQVSKEEPPPSPLNDVTTPPTDEPQIDTITPMDVDMLSGDESDHSITAQMSPLSCGAPSPPPIIPAYNPTGIKRAADFVGKIPKVRKDSPSIESNDKDNKSRHKNGVTPEKKDKELDKTTNSEKSKDWDKSRSKNDEKNSNSKSKSDSKSSRDKSRSHNDKDRSRDRKKESERSSDKDRGRNDKSKSSSDKDRSRDKNKQSDSKTKDCESEKPSSDKDRSRDKEKHKSRDREKESSRSKDKERKEDSSRTREKEKRSSDKSKTSESSSNKNIEKSKEKNNNPSDKADDKEKINNSENSSSSKSSRERSRSSHKR